MILFHILDANLMIMKRLFIAIFLLILPFSCKTGKMDHTKAMAEYEKTAAYVQDDLAEEGRLFNLAQKMKHDQVNIMFNNLQVYKYYLLFKSELENRNVYVVDKSLGIKYYLIEEGLNNGPELAAHCEESFSNPEKKYILFSPELLKDENKLKAAVYRELTLRMELGLTGRDSEILKERTTDYDYSNLTERDYNKLFKLIKKRMGDKYIQVIVFDS